MERAWYSDFKAESNSIPVAKYVEIHHAPQMPLHAINEIPFSCSTSHSSPLRPYLSLRASRSDSRRQRMSSSRTERRFVSSCAHSSSFILQIHRSTQLRFREYLEVGENHTWALDVADNASGGIVHKLNSDLGDTSTGTYMRNPSASSYFYPSSASLCNVEPTSAAQDTSDLDQLDGNL